MSEPPAPSGGGDPITPGSGAVPDADGGSEGSVELVGTAHISPDSVAEVEETIAERRPDVVAVELDEGRYRQLKGDAPDDLDASDLLHGNTVFQFLAYWMLSYVQTKMGERFDIEPGADMMAAVETAEDHGIDVALVDRDIQVTIQRFWNRLTGFEKAKLLGGLIGGMAGVVTGGFVVGAMLGMFVATGATLLGGPYVVPAGVAGSIPVASGLVVSALDWLLVAGGITLVVGAPLALAFQRLVGVESGEGDGEEFDLENLTDTDVVTAMMEEFRQFSPGGAEALIDERDAYIAYRLVALREAGYDVVAVVGAGHRAGIQAYLDDPGTLPPQSSLTGRISGSRFSLYKLFGYLFTLGFGAFFVLLVLGGAQEAFLIRLFGAWFLVNGVIAAALAKVGGAHWPSALVGGGIAWLTSVNPLLAPGWFAGYVELRYIDVNIGDISTLNEIISDETAPIADIYRRLTEVPLFRLIAIVALTNVGSMIASFLFIGVVAPALFAEIGGTGEIVRLMFQGAENGLDLLLGLLP